MTDIQLTAGSLFFLTLGIAGHSVLFTVFFNTVRYTECIMLRVVRIIIYLSFTQACAQINMFDALEKKFILDLDAESFPELKFKWDFDGKAQASVNAGMTELIDDKNYEKAIKNFDDAIAQLPALGPAYYYRGVCNRLLNNLAEAKKDFIKAAEVAPEHTEILLELAEIHELQFQYTDAEKLYEKALKMEPDFAEAYFNLANLNIRQQLFGKAVRNFKRSLEIDSTFIESHVRQGILAFSMDKRASKTFAHFDNALKIDSTCQAALFWRGMMFLKDENVPKCLEDWNKLVLYNPESPLFILLRAFLYMDLADYENAFIDLKKVFSRRYEDENLFRGAQTFKDKQLDLQFAASYVSRNIYGLQDDPAKLVKNGFCLMVMERRKEAITEFKRSFRMEPSALPLFLIALTYEHQKKHDSALVYYDEALKYDNDIFDAHKKRAIYRSELKDWRGANRDFAEMIRLEPGLTVTYRLRSMIRIQFKDYYGAIIDLTNFLKIDSTDHEIFLFRAVSKNAVEDFKGANADYRNALKIKTDKYELYEHVVRSDLQLKDTTHALLTIEKCDEAFGLHTYLFTTRIRIYIHQKKISDARKELKKAIDDKWLMSMLTVEDNSLVLFLDAWVDFLENDHNNALKKLNKSVTLYKQNYEAMYLRSKIFLALDEKSKAIKDLKTLAAVGYADSTALLNNIE